MAVLFLIVLMSYATWKGTRTPQRWFVLLLGLMLCIAGTFTPDLIAIGIVLGSIVLMSMYAPVIDARGRRSDENSHEPGSRWTGSDSENQLIVREYERSRERGVGAHGHLVNPTTEFKKLAEEEQL